MTKPLVITPSQLAVELGKSTTTLWRWQQQNLLPKPIYIGNKALGWRRETIIEWLSNAEQKEVA